MIIWTRWGILVLLFVGLGAAIGFALDSIVDIGGDRFVETDGIFIGIGLILASPALAVFDRLVVRRHLDKPRPVLVTERIAQPVAAPDGSTRTERTVPAVHPETGRPIMATPTSSLFFIPIRFWPYVLAGIGVVVMVIGLGELANG